MAQTSDLMGTGDSGPHATLAGHQIASSLAGTSTTQAAGTPLPTSVVAGNSLSGATGYVLPVGSRAFPLAKEIYFFNVGDTTALIYAPAGGATLNGSTSAAVSVSANKGCLFMCVSGSGGSAPQWVALNSA